MIMETEYVPRCNNDVKERRGQLCNLRNCIFEKGSLKDL